MNARAANAATACGVYFGRVQHRRTVPRARAFGYRLFLLYLDLDQAEAAFAGRWVWGWEKARPFSFRRRDYLGPIDVPLADAVRARVQSHLGRRPAGAIRMLTQVRCFGYVFNPVTLYYCFTPDARLDAVVAEITNTPWNERHTYVVDALEGAAVGARFAKAFHVSPFQPMQQEYDWTFAPPGEQLAVHMRSWQGGAVVHEAGLAMTRVPWSARALRRALLRHPAMAVKVILGIHWQALCLWLRRTPFFVHPRKQQVKRERVEAMR